jgi:nicotinamidase/pyrazinamidase
VKTVFFDVDTQIDFVYPAGSLHVPGAPALVPAWTTLTRVAATNAVTLVSTADAHSEDDPEFKTWTPHCVVGTVGQMKIAPTLLKDPITISSVHGALDSLAKDLANVTQFIVEKQHLDAFTNPNLLRLLHTLRADRYVVYGVVSEFCVHHALRGLFQTGAQIQVVTDAIMSLDQREEENMLRWFEGEGGVLTSVATVSQEVQTAPKSS